MKRYLHDLSHFDFNSGKIGGLQTMAAIHVVAGDGISVSMEGLWRLSPLRRNLVVDCQVDLFAFYIPYRHIYGQQWIDFIKEGASEDETFTGVTMPATASVVSYLGSELALSEVAPLWRTAGYNRIWNRYFRSPTDTLTRADTFVAVDAERASGFSTGYLPVPWSTSVSVGVPATERDVAVTGGGTVFDIVDLERVKRSYRTEVDRKYFGQRYSDILNVGFGSRVNIDADERPQLVAHTKWWLSGYDVDGTSDISLGQYSGKAAAVGHFMFRRKMFPEHGTLWLMELLRFPTIHQNERPFMHKTVNPTYLEAAGDADLISAEPPETAFEDDYFLGAAANSLGIVPYGQHYRYYPSHVHQAYKPVQGFSFTVQDVNTIDRAHYIEQADYTQMFQTAQLQHWQSQVRIEVKAMRVVPPARRSLYAGA